MKIVAFAAASWLGMQAVAGWGADANANAAAGALPSAESAIVDIRRAVDERRLDYALLAYGRLIDSDAFAVLEPQRQRAIVALAAALAAQLKDVETARKYSHRITAMPGADRDNWRQRATVAMSIGDFADAAGSLAMIASRWPDELARIPGADIGRTINRTAELDNPDPALELLYALDKAGWVKSQDIVNSSYYRYTIASLALQRGDSAQAMRYARQVVAVRELIKMRADKRFTAIVAANRQQFDIASAAARQVAEHRKVVARLPRSLRELNILCQAMRVNRQLAEGVTLLDQALARWRTPGGEQSFDDPEAIVWVMNLRSNLLQDLGRVDEAVNQLREAARLNEERRSNISQVLNLANLYVDLGRSKEALQLLTDNNYVGGSTSAYGRMVLERIRYFIARENGDAAELLRSRDYIVQHRGDSEGIHQLVLIEEGSLDQVAASMIAELNDPKTRIQALAAAQDFAEPPFIAPAVRKAMSASAALYAREDVRAAVAQYGRIERYDIHAL